MERDDVVEIRMLRLDVGAAAVRDAASLLSRDERQRARSFARPCDCRRFTVTRAALRRQLGERLGVAPQTIEFAYGPHGKPCLAGSQAGADVHFNVSHSDDFAALAFASGGEIGVDIEALRAVPDAETIAGSLASPVERRAWKTLPARQRVRGFFNWWTRKEAFVKARGGGLSIPLDAFDVAFAPGASARLLRVAGAPGEGAGWSLRAFAPGPHLVGAVAFASGEMETETRVARD
jgi:4'-phosphopantetheinyl transferase